MPFPYPKNTLHSPRVRGRLSGLQLPFESGNPVFQFSNLFLHISELCIPTQHNAPPDAPSVEMLSSLGKTWQRRIGCHTRVLLPKKSLGSASALYMRMQPWGGLKNP